MEIITFIRRTCFVKEPKRFRFSPKSQKGLLVFGVSEEIDLKELREPGVIVDVTFHDVSNRPHTSSWKVSEHGAHDLFNFVAQWTVYR